ncbi:MAG: transglycosylase domain-containing protein, partial [Clostridia bacterium]|nr:transglycosylase domain-containing protein [Clostridia bacterium]
MFEKNKKRSRSKSAPEKGVSTSVAEKKRTKAGDIKHLTLRFLGYFTLFSFLFAIVAVLILGNLIYDYAIDTLPFDYANISSSQLQYASIIYALDEDGNPVEYKQIHGSENRLWVDYQDIPQNLKDAFVAIEDERFYDHSGFDLPRTFKATYNYIFNKNDSYGGSTINQQLVKNLTGENDKSAERKVIEIFRAIHMDEQLTKDQILELYLNTIYLSQGCNGVKTAAQKYFGKDV